METTAPMVSSNYAANHEHINLPQMASLSINEALKPEGKGEVKRGTVVLHSDIWYMVFAELVKKNHNPSSHPNHGRRAHTIEFDIWLRTCRLVSQDFSTIVTPLGYGLVDMSGYLIMDRLPNVSGHLKDGFLSTVQNVTTVLQLPHIRDFQFETHVSHLIESCQKLKKVQFENKIQRGDHTGYSLSYLASLWLSSFLNNKTMPQGCEVSVKCNFLVIEQVPTPWDGDEIASNELCDPAAECSIDCLVVDFSGLTTFKTLSPTGKRLPAMTSLSLTSYHWTHPRKEFDLLWNFSDLNILTLDRMNLIHFFTRVPVQAWWELESLEIVEPTLEFSADQSLELLQEQERTRTVMGYVFSCLNNLDHLEIACDDLHLLFPVNIIAGSLEQLKSLELTGNYEEQHISLTSLQEILLVAKNVEVVIFEFNPLDTDALKILRVLAQTRRLRRVELRMYACNLGVVQSEPSGTDPEYDAADVLVQYMHSQRLGPPLLFRLWVRHSIRPPAWKSVDGQDWKPCRVYESRISSNGAYEQCGSQRIGGRKTDQAIDIGGDGVNDGDGK